MNALHHDSLERQALSRMAIDNHATNNWFGVSHVLVASRDSLSEVYPSGAGIQPRCKLFSILLLET